MRLAQAMKARRSDSWLGWSIHSNVEHDGQHRRQAVGGADASGAAEVLVEQADVGDEPHRHVAVHGGLEFDEQVEVEPAVSPAHPPDDVVLALPQVAAALTRSLSQKERGILCFAALFRLAVGDALQGGEVDLPHPGLVDVAAQQVGHHLGVPNTQNAELLVGGVVGGHGVQFSRWRPLGAILTVRQDNGARVALICDG